MKKTVIGVLLFATLYLGYLWGKWANDYTWIWNEGSEGINELISQMDGDDSRRMAIFLLTEKKAYAVTDYDFNRNSLEIYYDPTAPRPGVFDSNHINNLVRN